MTIAHLDGQNFWGGGSYRHGQGYVDLPNNGSQRHDGWESIEVEDNRFAATEKLSWITQAGEHWIDETRGIAVETVDAEAGYWTLDFTTSLRNVRGEGAADLLADDGRASAGRLWRAVLAGAALFRQRRSHHRGGA